MRASERRTAVDGQVRLLHRHVSSDFTGKEASGRTQSKQATNEKVKHQHDLETHTVTNGTADPQGAIGVIGSFWVVSAATGSASGAKLLLARLTEVNFFQSLHRSERRMIVPME